MYNLFGHCFCVFTSCALNGLPLGMQDQSQKQNKKTFVLQKFCLHDVGARGTCMGPSSAWGTTWISQKAFGLKNIVDCEFGGG